MHRFSWILATPKSLQLQLNTRFGYQSQTKGSPYKLTSKAWKHFQTSKPHELLRIG